MFSGQYEYRVDAKGRITIPPKFRQDFKEGIVLTRGLDKCITVYTPDGWEKIAETYAASAFARQKSRRKNRFIFGFAFALQLDREGRVGLPPPLRQYAEIGETVIIVGANEHLEFWDREHWESESSLMGGEEEVWQLFETAEEGRP